MSTAIKFSFKKTRRCVTSNMAPNVGRSPKTPPETEEDDFHTGESTGEEEEDQESTLNQTDPGEEDDDEEAEEELPAPNPTAASAATDQGGAETSEANPEDADGAPNPTAAGAATGKGDAKANPPNPTAAGAATGKGDAKANPEDDADDPNAAGAKKTIPKSPAQGRKHLKKKTPKKLTKTRKTPKAADPPANDPGAGGSGQQGGGEEAASQNPPEDSTKVKKRKAREAQVRGEVAAMDQRIRANTREVAHNGMQMKREVEALLHDIASLTDKATSEQLRHLLADCLNTLHNAPTVLLAYTRLLTIEGNQRGADQATAFLYNRVSTLGAQVIELKELIQVRESEEMAAEARREQERRDREAEEQAEAQRQADAAAAAEAEARPARMR
ncbi:MAG: hypothetical protein AAFQ62_16720 [Pseudomonadota bacterium]